MEDKPWALVTLGEISAPEILILGYPRKLWKPGFVLLKY